MGRPAKYSIDQILDTAAELVASGGPGAVTVGAISERLGAPSGSIYHRFPARDLILVSLWVRTVRRAQEGFLAALSEPAPGAAVDAALHPIRWARANPAEARVLLLYRREDLLVEGPEALSDELASLNDQVTHALRTYALWLYGSAAAPARERVTFALVDLPYAAVRRPLLAGRRPPPLLDELIATSVLHVLGPDA